MRVEFWYSGCNTSHALNPLVPGSSPGGPTRKAKPQLEIAGVLLFERYFK